MITPPGPPRNRRPSHLLGRADCSQRPEIRVGHPGELGFDRFEEVAGDVEAGVGGVRADGWETHRCAVATSRPCLFVVGAAGVPA